jgi:hypothetical protein
MICCVQTVDFTKARAFAKSLGAECFETSAETGQGVEAVFTHIGKMLLAFKFPSHWMLVSERRQHLSAPFLFPSPVRALSQREPCLIGMR